MLDDQHDIFKTFKRKNSVAELDTVDLANEFLSCVRWDQALRNLLFHGGHARPPEIRKKLSYHIDKNAPYIAEIYNELTRRGEAGVKELEKLFLLEDPEVIYRLRNAHIEYFPETARQVLSRMLASEALERKHRGVLTDILGAVERRLAGIK